MFLRKISFGAAIKNMVVPFTKKCAITIFELAPPLCLATLVTVFGTSNSSSKAIKGHKRALVSLR